MPESRVRGYAPGRFSFNVKGGRCEACAGGGYIQIEMQFLPNVTMPCEVCQGQRYNREALEITLKDKNISEVLDMTVSEGAGVLLQLPAVAHQAGDPERRGVGVHPPGAAGNDPQRRRGPAREAGDGIVAPRYRQDPVHPGRAHHRTVIPGLRCSPGRGCTGWWMPGTPSFS